MASRKLACSAGNCFSLTLTPVAKLSRRSISSIVDPAVVLTAFSRNRSGVRCTALVKSLSSGCRNDSALRFVSLTRVDGGELVAESALAETTHVMESSSCITF